MPDVGEGQRRRHAVYASVSISSALGQWAQHIVRVWRGGVQGKTYAAPLSRTALRGTVSGGAGAAAVGAAGAFALALAIVLEGNVSAGRSVVDLTYGVFP